MECYDSQVDVARPLEELEDALEEDSWFTTTRGARHPASTKLKAGVQKKHLRMSLVEDSEAEQGMGSLVEGGNCVMNVQLGRHHYRSINSRRVPSVNDVTPLKITGAPEYDQDAEDVEALAATLEMDGMEENRALIVAQRLVADDKYRTTIVLSE